MQRGNHDGRLNQGMSVIGLALGSKVSRITSAMNHGDVYIMEFANLETACCMGKFWKWSAKRKANEICCFVLPAGMV